MIKLLNKCDFVETSVLDSVTRFFFSFLGLRQHSRLTPVSPVRGVLTPGLCWREGWPVYQPETTRKWLMLVFWQVKILACGSWKKNDNKINRDVSVLFASCSFSFWSWGLCSSSVDWFSLCSQFRSSFLQPRYELPLRLCKLLPSAANINWKFSDFILFQLIG